MNTGYIIQIVFDESGKKNQVGYLCYSWLKECYYLAYDLLSCGHCFQSKEVAYEEIRDDKDIIIDNIKSINDRKIVSMGVIKVEARIVNFYNVPL